MIRWIVMPTLDCWNYTEPALFDCRAQQGMDPHVLVIDTGSSNEVREKMEQLAGRHHPRVVCWFTHPPRPALGATWNAGLNFVWQAGGEMALVVNNDVRLHRDTYARLAEVCQTTPAGFVSGVGVTEAQFDPELVHRITYEVVNGQTWVADHGGPDFSCFVITRDFHAQYPFDKRFVPCYHEDNDLHRRVLLAGDGRRMVGVNVPFLHYGSRTINRSPEIALAFAAKFRQSQETYVKKWGGVPGEETYTRPDDPESVAEHVTNPELWARSLVTWVGGQP